MDDGICGIYVITSPSGKFYVGSSINVRRRFSSHRSDLKHGRHHCPSLQAAANKHGVGSLRCSVIESCRPDELVAREQAAIDRLRPEYNGTSDARTPCRDPAVAARLSKSIRASAAHVAARTANQRLAARAISKPVVRLTDGAVFPSGYAAARAHGIKSADNITTAIRLGRRFAGHFWKYEGDRLTLAEAESRAAQRRTQHNERSGAHLRARCARAVRRLSDGTVFPTVTDAARAAGCHHTAICRSLKCGTPSMGAVWRYA
jgi:hypothetical protein